MVCADDPAVALEPLQPGTLPLALQEVAYVEDQFNVTWLPELIGPLLLIATTGGCQVTLMLRFSVRVPMGLVHVIDAV